MSKHGKPDTDEKSPIGRIRRIGKWGWAAILVAISSVLTLAATSAAPNFFNAPAAGDAIRGGDVPAFVQAFSPGDALNLSLGDVSDVRGSWNVAFSRADSSRATPFMIERPYETFDTGAAMRDEMKAGAYAVDGLSMEVTVEGRRNQEINILNVRPEIHREQIVDGTSIYMGTEGGGPTEHLEYDLDTPHPVAQEVDYESPDAGTPHPFFSSKRVSLKNGENDTFVLELSAIKGAYSFVVDFDYEVGGKQFTQVLTLDGQPFRVTPSLCSRPIDGNHPIPQQVLTDRAAKSYNRVLYSHVNPVDYSYRMVTGDPKSFCLETSQVGKN